MWKNLSQRYIFRLPWIGKTAEYSRLGGGEYRLCGAIQSGSLKPGNARFRLPLVWLNGAYLAGL
ncbi:hypothetical protein GCWU000324_01559 [Kingella oralis ATCC 51147]|uniref:Uncharacterized protein n=1 Tax=Kingella oralis ATCC 51147 TaxID=629741 RepID=C4GKQ4_9NEIS|nr:hypothetical protein GCWU000324_01559 [Kingella oralis ATCC 51147]